MAVAGREGEPVTAVGGAVVDEETSREEEGGDGVVAC